MTNVRTILKKAVIVLMLVITPLAQANVVFVCSMMNGEAVEHCCCPDAKSRRSAGDNADAAACCTVSIEMRDVEFASTSPDDQKAKRLGDNSPDVAIVSAAPLQMAFSAAVQLPMSGVDDLLPSSARLYLLTARLRL